MTTEIKVSYASKTIVERVDPDGNSFLGEFPNCHPELRAGELHVIDSDTGEVCAFFARGAFVSFRSIKADDAA